MMFYQPTRKREKVDYRYQDLMSNDRGDSGYVAGVETRPTFLESRRTKKEAKVIELSEDESGIPEEPVVRQNIPRKKPNKKKSVAQNLKELTALRESISEAPEVPEMQQQDRRPSATQSTAPALKTPETAHPDETREQDATNVEEDPDELRLSMNSEDEAELTAEQEEGLSLAQEVINGKLALQ